MGIANRYYPIADRELDLVSVHHCCHHSVLNVRRWNRARDNMVQKDIGERLVFFWRIKIIQIDASISERLVGWCEHREWTCTR